MRAHFTSLRKSKRGSNYKTRNVKVINNYSPSGQLPAFTTLPSKITSKLLEAWAPSVSLKMLKRDPLEVYNRKGAPKIFILWGTLVSVGWYTVFYLIFNLSNTKISLISLNLAIKTIQSLNINTCLHHTHTHSYIWSKNNRNAYTLRISHLQKQPTPASMHNTMKKRTHTKTCESVQQKKGQRS